MHELPNLGQFQHILAKKAEDLIVDDLIYVFDLVTVLSHYDLTIQEELLELELSLSLSIPDINQTICLSFSKGTFSYERMKNADNEFQLTAKLPMQIKFFTGSFLSALSTPHLYNLRGNVSTFMKILSFFNTLSKRTLNILESTKYQ